MIDRRTPRLALSMVLAAGSLVAPLVAAAQYPPPAGAQPVQPASPYDPSMQAGGLAPPPPMDMSRVNTPSSAPSRTTEEELDQAKEKDSGRGLTFVWLNAEGGFEHVGLRTLNVDEENFTAGFIESSASGWMLGAGVGARLLFLTIGARGRVGFFSSWQLFSVGGEVGLRFPFGNLEPHVDLGGGYVALGSVRGALNGADDAVSIRGFYVRAGGGLDYFVTPAFSIGANASAEIMGLTRPGLSPDRVAAIKSDPNYDPERVRADALALEGTSYGTAIAVTGVLGLHF